MAIVGTMRKDTENWIATAEYDIETARHMFGTGRFLYVVFMCHLALEKMLKAHVAEVTGKPAAKTHNLVYLLKKAGLTVPIDLQEFLGEINQASLPTRYPEDLNEAMLTFTADVSRTYLERTEELIKWLRSHPNLGK